ncbi:hypothetical protein M8756_16360 [Lutimaribacter sp. EGI FJ00015]|uniref:Uncharacterized protein n=1 Tax=Lutimaribacter degradans TaxID=2945989 RepID=A0ACC6A0W6_9RHOB|nr:hypothetical protein [Lutimaribacter sp. EGI FJ00013]MCM2563705.1 hypothetical protein [Lutimaribacter sp. EGI FJ00013]MCO0614889.1 hypothetical protein [Lutimaribacter sp. EGI FJ00015]MCO0637557.1 hypothetical protein [Lutimaribacter sp. EGI FJ00014]
MSRRFIATILVGALAVTGLTAVPARADGEDIAKALAGIAALAIIAKTIENRNDRRHEAEVSRQGTWPKHGHVTGPIRPRPLPDHVRKASLLPRECLVNVRSRHRDYRAFSGRCLADHRITARNLPNACMVETRGRGHRYNQIYFRESCLRDRGYRTARY